MVSASRKLWVIKRNDLECVLALRPTCRTRDREYFEVSNGGIETLTVNSLARGVTDSLTGWLNRMHKAIPGKRWREISKCSGDHSELFWD